MQNQSNKLPEDEIDFGMIGTRIWAFFVYPIKLLLQNLVTTLVFTIAAIIVSISLKFMIPKSYSATFIIKPSEKNEKIHIRILGDLQLLWKLNDTKSLARELKLDEDVVGLIDKIAVTNYSFAKNRADSSNLTSIELQVSDNKNLLPIQNAILNYLEENPYFKRIKDLNTKSISLRKTLIDNDILLLDSLKKLQLSSYDKLKVTEQNSVLLKDVINPTSTYTLSLERMNQKTGLLYQSEFIDNFQLVKGVVTSEQHTWPPRILHIGFVIGPIFLLFCFIYLYIKKEKLNQQNHFKVWNRSDLPKKILAIRLQALGDTFIALSYLQYLRENLPANTVIDFVVREEFENIPNNLLLFNKVYTIKGGNPLKKQMLSALKHIFQLRKANYDVVLDLQNNQISKFIRKVVKPPCFVEFDRYSPIHACNRNINTINKSGFIHVKEGYLFKFKNPDGGKIILHENGFRGEKLILLNPAGAFTNRNWPTQNYITLAALFQEYFKQNVKFLILGVTKIKTKANEIKNALGDKVILLIDKTSAIEAFNIIQHIDLCISEDGALMHIAYLSKKSTIGILGSSRSDWVDPKLPHTFYFTSNDLACGNCMQSSCMLGTNLCMTRVSPESVFEKSKQLLKVTNHD